RSYLSLGEHAHLGPDQAFPAARRASGAALALEDSAEARLLRGSVLLEYDWDWAGAERDLTRAVALAPRSAEAWARLARFRSVAGDDEGAIADARRAEALDPGDDAVGEELASCLRRARRFDESAREWRRLADRRGISSHHALFSIFRHAGRDAEALDEARLAMEVAGAPADQITAVTRLGPVAGARAYLNGTIAYLARGGGLEPVPPERLAVLWAQLGETGRAIDRLLEAFVAHSPSLPATLRDPDLDALHGEQRFRSILGAVGIGARRPKSDPVALIAFAAATGP
ncbi:MAG: hypothetical protein ABI584_12705, partial [Acidobacteriota bacterium]